MNKELDDLDISLEDAIDIIYGNADAFNDIPSGHKNPITEMFEISDISENYVKLQHLFNDSEFYPVELPNVILRLLSIGQVFLMTISEKESCWRVSYMSSPYDQIGS